MASSASSSSRSHGPLASPKIRDGANTSAQTEPSARGRPSHYYTRHFDNETFLCCPVPNKSGTRAGSPVSAVFLADRLQRLNFLSRTNYILSLLCLLVIGNNVVTLVLNVLNVQRAPLGPDDPVPGPDEPPPSVMDKSGLEKAFHCVEFWTAFSFSLIEVLVIVYSPRSVSDIYSKSPWMFKLIIVAQVVSTFVSAMLVTLDLEIFEVAAHEVEYANEILLSFLNVILAGRLTGARTAFNRGGNAYGPYGVADSESRAIDLAIDREDLNAQLLPNRQQSRNNLPPYPEIYCPPVRSEGATGAVFSSSSSAVPNDVKKDAQENASDLALVNPESAEITDGAPGSTGGITILLAGGETGGWSSTCATSRSMRRRMLTCLANVPMVLSPIMAISLMFLYNDVLGASDPMQKNVNILLTGEVQAHFLEFIFNIGSAAVAFAFCMDNKMLCDLQMSELIGEWSQGIIN